MPIIVRLPAPWRKPAGDRREIEVNGATVGEALANLAADVPALRERLYGSDGRIASIVAVFLNQDSINRLQGLDTPVSEGDRITLLMAIAGG